MGAGFTGLSCAVELVDVGVDVEVFEKNDHVGGLAGGLSRWDWSLECFYHHIFTNDTDIIAMARVIMLIDVFVEIGTHPIEIGLHAIEGLDAPKRKDRGKRFYVSRTA